MEGYLSKNKIDYVMFHLGSVIELSDDIQSQMIFSKKGEEDPSPGIHMPLSKAPLDLSQIIKIENIPVLFPMSKQGRFYRIEGGQVFFNHDLLKSAFYLLSGYQETVSEVMGEHGRFPYSFSVQRRLNITHKPVVNYYFEKLAEGIEQFCRLNGIPFTRKRLFTNWGLMLTHDVDQLSTYNIHEFFYRLKILLSLVPSKWSFARKRRIFFRYLMGMLIFFNRPNLHWNFEALRRIEKRFAMNSVFYFLPKARKDQHSFYRIDEPRIRELVRVLSREGCEVGVHGTYESAGDVGTLYQLARRFRETLGRDASGIRQHFLRYNMPETAIYQQSAGFEYDTTLGFAEHEGFRNSYCLPFKPYDFEQDQMIDIWELPLVAMDATLFRYRELSLQEAISAISRLLDEVERFNGLFTFLWHNGPIDDRRHRETEDFYAAILRFFSQKNPQPVTGQEMVKMMNSFVNPSRYKSPL